MCAHVKRGTEMPKVTWNQPELTYSDQLPLDDFQAKLWMKSSQGIGLKCNESITVAVILLFSMLCLSFCRNIKSRHFKRQIKAKRETELFGSLRVLQIFTLEYGTVATVHCVQNY